MRFQGKVAIITGGASGIGLAVAKRLASEGVRIVLADYNQENLDKATLDVDGTSVSARRHGYTLHIGDGAVLAVRPDDLHLDASGLRATVVSTEFRGHDHTGFARMADGTDLVFTADHACAPGTTVHLRPDPAHALAFPAP